MIENKNAEDSNICPKASRVVGRAKGTSSAAPGDFKSSRKRPSSQRDLGAARHERKTSFALSSHHVALIRDGAHHAVRLGLPLNRFITINWTLAGVEDAQRGQEIFTKHLRDWLNRKGFATAYIWVRERGPVTGVHTHLIAHVPPSLVRTMTQLQRRWLKAAGVQFRKGVLDTRPVSLSYAACMAADEVSQDAYRHNLHRLLDYLAKGADAEARTRFGLSRLPQYGEIVGKRAGSSRNVGTHAIRKWHEHARTTASPQAHEAPQPA